MKKILLLIIVMSTSVSAFSQQNDESAIKQLLEKESATWRSGDIKAHADCWVIRPYGRILISTADGAAFDVPLDMMINPPANMVGRGGFSINTNYKMHVSGNDAWVSHNEKSTAKDGSVIYSYEFRILEKVKGKWKLTGQSIHVYQPK